VTSRELRVGTAVDAHRLVSGRPLVLGGVVVESAQGLDGHSDADIVCHVILDASLGAAGAGDIGRMFPAIPEFRGAASIELLRVGWAGLATAGWRLVNADCMLILQAPRIAELTGEMRAHVAAAIGTEASRVSIRATSTDRLGFVGRGEGVAAQAVVLLER
jgi:2-C-methyl-D-erythritol 2,4-cyclodiphosphate synthase